VNKKGRRRNHLAQRRNPKRQILLSVFGLALIGSFCFTIINLASVQPIKTAPEPTSITLGFQFGAKKANAQNAQAQKTETVPAKTPSVGSSPSSGATNRSTYSTQTSIVSTATQRFSIPAITSDLFVQSNYNFAPGVPDYSNLVEGILTPDLGAVLFQGHKETFYNLDVSYFAPYSLRDDGVKIKPNGDIILACHTDYRGQRRMTSLGWGICLDTGGFAFFDHEQIDIAANW
jgi:hypothetical protein